MARLRDVLDWATSAGLIEPANASNFEHQLRITWGGDRVYIPPPHADEKAERIRQLARTLPTGVVAKRVGVSRQYVHKITKK